MILCSTAIMTPPNVTKLILSIRKDIKELAGKFGRENTEPHITINVFTPSLLAYWQQHIKQRISVAEPFKVSFSLVVVPVRDKYSLMFIPDQESKMELKKIMRAINTNSPKLLDKTENPHITVAYDLTYNQSETAKQYILTNNITMAFTCADVAIRKRESGKMEHYHVIQTFPFGAPVEGLLF